MGQSGVRLGKLPNPLTSIANKTGERARSIRVPRARDVVFPVILVHVGLVQSAVAEGVIVEDGGHAVVGNRSLQVSEVLVCDDIGDHHTAYGHWVGRECDHIRHAWERRTAVRNGLRHINSPAAVVSERHQAERGKE